jgi:anti-sigma regulatory factor (Ser/Thr protein kinase)
LANVKAIVRLSQSETPQGLKEVIEGRISALADVHALFVQSRWAGAELDRLVRQELSPYSREGKERTRIDGPMVMLKPDAAQAIAVALHELATNAAKYGALSVAKGQVGVEWSRAADGRLVLRWVEVGGPPVNPPSRKGFGSNCNAIEDQKIPAATIAGLFGTDVAAMVLEVTDDKALPPEKRKDLQILHAPDLSPGAKLIKLADKISSLHSLASSPPVAWTAERQLEYVTWCRRVVEGPRGAHKMLEALFDEAAVAAAIVHQTA